MWGTCSTTSSGPRMSKTSPHGHFIHNGVLDQDVNFISKPFTIEQFASKARAVLDGANS
jgi:hypothetical protein